MKKFLTALPAAGSLLIASVAAAEIQTYEGSEEYYVLGMVEDVNVARERAIRNAREKAGVYVHSYSHTKDFELVDTKLSPWRAASCASSKRITRRKLCPTPKAI